MATCGMSDKFITIPNKLVRGSVIVTYTRMPTRRVDVDVGVSYGADPDRAIPIAMDAMKKHSLVLGDPESAVVVTELADSGEPATPCLVKNSGLLDCQRRPDQRNL